jgi:peptide/nickel transport system substrate-binding protein
MSHSRLEEGQGESSKASAIPRRNLLKGMVAGGTLVAAGGAASACGNSGTTATTSSGSAVMPKRGGNLRVALTGGSSADTLDAAFEVTTLDVERLYALYNGVCRISFDARSVENDLAEEIEPNSTATEWTIRLRSGVTFHNGKDLTSEDVLFTFNRIMNPKKPGDGASVLKPVMKMQILDPLTLRLYMDAPYSTFPQSLCESQNFGIVPVGYDPQRPVGTGPFKYKSFTPGEQSVFTRNENYFKPGLPHLDELTIIDFADDESAMNAVVSNAADMFGEASPSLATEAQSSSLKTLTSLPGLWTPFTMRVDKPPFNDVRVRQAFRLIVDRPALIASSLDGFGTVGNDLFSPADPCYNRSLHRSQDLDEAKFLLKQAGQDGLTVQLNTANFAAGVVAAAQVFAQEAKGAGVTVNIANLPVSTFYGPDYLQWVFAQDFWGTSFYLSQVAQSMLVDSPFNETHWNDAQYTALYKEANATLNAAKRCQIINEMEQIDFQSGGYIIAAYNKILNVLSPRVNGLVAQASGLPLSTADIENVWLE